MKYSAQGSGPIQAEQSGLFRNYNCTECFSWDNAPKPSDVTEVIVGFRPEYVQKIDQNFTERGCSW